MIWAAVSKTLRHHWASWETGQWTSFFSFLETSVVWWKRDLAHTPNTPLIRTITSWRLGQVQGKVSCVSRCVWNRPWSHRGCTESQRIPILSGPAIHSTLTYPAQPYTLDPPLFRDLPGVRYVAGAAARYNKYSTDSGSQREPSERPSLLRTHVCQDVGKFWSQVLTGSMERESIAAVSCLVIRKVRATRAFHQPRATPTWSGRPALKETFWDCLGVQWLRPFAPKHRGPRFSPWSGN